MKEHEKIKETLEKQLKQLSERSNKALSVEEICCLNKEICRTTELLLNLTVRQLGT